VSRTGGILYGVNSDNLLIAICKINNLGVNKANSAILVSIGQEARSDGNEEDGLCH
jgi:hypothetical protein